MHANGADSDAKYANAGEVETPPDDSKVVLDLPRALALARAVDAFITGGLATHARPVARELVLLLEAAQGEVASVTSIGSARPTKGR